MVIQFLAQHLDLGDLLIDGMLTPRERFTAIVMGALDAHGVPIRSVLVGSNEIRFDTLRAGISKTTHALRLPTAIDFFPA